MRKRYTEKDLTPEIRYTPARAMKQVSNFDAKDVKILPHFGIGFGRDEYEARDNLLAMKDQGRRFGGAMDNQQPLITTASVTIPVQFLQTWLKGVVNITTAIRTIDDLIGLSATGSWADEEVVQAILEMTGTARPYTDYSEPPLSSYNLNYDRRTVVRFEEASQSFRLEEERADRVRINDAATKRIAAANALEINRNLIGFFGYNSGAIETYGFLNDPGLLSYNTLAPSGTGGSTTWASKDYLQIVEDLIQMFSGLFTQGQGQVNVNAPMTLALPINVITYLGLPSQYGNSVREWLTQTYPSVRVVAVPELQAANGGQNVAYLYAEKVIDESTDGGRTWDQPVPTKFMVLGVKKDLKSYIEAFSNSTAGAIAKRPFAIYRSTGL